jgi:uncharacterized protein YjbI with pentapeptide repeats
MRLASLTNSNPSTPRMAGLQAQASTANVAQAQKAEAFTPPSGRIQRQGQTTRKHVEMLIAAIDKQLREAFDANALAQGFSEHHEKLLTQRESLLRQLKPKKTWGSRLLETLLGGRKLSCQNGYFAGLDLQGLDFSGVDFQDSNFQYSNFSRAILDSADLRGTQLSFANFKKAKLRDANLNGADWTKTRLLEDPLKGADLEGAFGRVDGLTPERLATAKNTDVLKEFMGSLTNNTLLYYYHDLEKSRQWKARQRR